MSKAIDEKSDAVDEKIRKDIFTNIWKFDKAKLELDIAYHNGWLDEQSKEEKNRRSRLLGILHTLKITKDEDSYTKIIKNLSENDRKFLNRLKQEKKGIERLSYANQSKRIHRLMWERPSEKREKRKGKK